MLFFKARKRITTHREKTCSAKGSFRRLHPRTRKTHIHIRRRRIVRLGCRYARVCLVQAHWGDQRFELLARLFRTVHSAISHFHQHPLIRSPSFASVVGNHGTQQLVQITLTCLQAYNHIQTRRSQQISLVTMVHSDSTYKYG